MRKTKAFGGCYRRCAALSLWLYSFYCTYQFSVFDMQYHINFKYAYVHYSNFAVRTYSTVIVQYASNFATQCTYTVYCTLYTTV